LFETSASDAERAIEMIRQGEAHLLASNLSDGPPQGSATGAGPARKRSAVTRRPDSGRSTR
jgi:hypothetical protein